VAACGARTAARDADDRISESWFTRSTRKIRSFESLANRPLAREDIMASMDEQFAALMERGRKELDELRSEWEIRHRADVRFLTESMQTRMEGEVSKIKAQATGVTVAVVTAVVIGLLAFMYSGVKDAYSGMKDVNQAVIALQDNLMKAQGTIKTTTAELDTAKNAGEKLIRDSVTALQTAQQTLATTQKAYEERLQEFRGTQVRQ
jgi:hypothetical protein